MSFIQRSKEEIIAMAKKEIEKTSQPYNPEKNEIVIELLLFVQDMCKKQYEDGFKAGLEARC